MLAGRGGTSPRALVLLPPRKVISRPAVPFRPGFWIKGLPPGLGSSFFLSPSVLPMGRGWTSGSLMDPQHRPLPLHV